MTECRDLETSLLNLMVAIENTQELMKLSFIEIQKLKTRNNDDQKLFADRFEAMIKQYVESK